jgi:hypothetical protein
MIADTQWIIAWAERATPDQLAAGMSVPTSWDPYFSAWMSRAYQHRRTGAVVGTAVFMTLTLCEWNLWADRFSRETRRSAG